MDYKIQLLKTRILTTEGKIYVNKIELDCMREQLLTCILATCSKADGMILNEIAEKYQELGIFIDHRTIYKNYIVPLVKKGILEKVNPGAKRNKKYRLKNSMTNHRIHNSEKYPIS